MSRNPRDKFVSRTRFVPETVACKFESPAANDVTYSVKASIQLFIGQLCFPMDVLHCPQHAGITAIEAGFVTLCKSPGLGPIQKYHFSCCSEQIYFPFIA